MANEADKKKKDVKERRPSAQKRDLQSEKRRLRNRSFKSQVRTAVRDFEASVSKGDAKDIQVQLNAVYSLMDKGVKQGVYKHNKANRDKSRLAARAAAKP